MNQLMPDACTLTSVKLGERRNGLLAALGRRVVEHAEPRDGPIRLEPSGPEGMKEFHAELLGVDQ